MNAHTLKTAFKHQFGLSIGKYKKSFFMEYIQQLLLGMDNAIDVQQPSNFTIVFQHHLGYAGVAEKEQTKTHLLTVKTPFF